MQKAASATLFNLTNDLLIAAGKSDVRELRSRYRFGFFMTKVNCNVGPLRAYKLAWLSLPHWMGQSFVVKTHNPPSAFAQIFTRLNILRATYIYRDPRDVALSVFEHGKRLREQRFDSNTQFDTIETMEEAIQFTQSLLPTWDAWSNFPHVLLIRFEDFRSMMADHAKALVDFLGLTIGEKEFTEIIDRYDYHRKGTNTVGSASTHFHGGSSGRWRQKMSKDQIQMSEELFNNILGKMGYQSAHKDGSG
jgi:hypothetical protein